MSNNAKPVYVMKEWRLSHSGDPSKNIYILLGFVNGRINVSKNESVTTSRILTIDFVNKIAETENSFYKLG